MDESDEDIADAEGTQQSTYEEEDDEIIESDIELEGDTMEPDNDPPQKVLFSKSFEFPINKVFYVVNNRVAADGRPVD